jgi:hypothetical protein
MPGLNFLALPSEVRLRIYEYVFAGLRISLMGHGMRPLYHQDLQFRTIEYTYDFNALLICRTVYREAAPILGSSIDLFFCNGARPTDVSSLTRDRYFEQIKSVSIDYDFDETLDLSCFPSLLGLELCRYQEWHDHKIQFNSLSREEASRRIEGHYDTEIKAKARMELDTLSKSEWVKRTVANRQRGFEVFDNLKIELFREDLDEDSEPDYLTLEYDIDTMETTWRSME